MLMMLIATIDTSEILILMTRRMIIVIISTQISTFTTVMVILIVSKATRQPLEAQSGTCTTPRLQPQTYLTCGEARNVL